MASWVYAYVKTYQMVHFTCSLSHINFTSIKLFEKYKERITSLSQPKAAWEGPQSTTVLPAEAPTQWLHDAPVAPTASEIKGVNICSKYHFASCEVTYSCCSPHRRSIVGGSTPDRHRLFRETLSANTEHWQTLGKENLSMALKDCQHLIAIVRLYKGFFSMNHLGSPYWRKKKIFKKNTSNITHHDINFLPIYFQTKKKQCIN